MKNSMKSNRKSLLILAVIVAAGICIWAAVYFTKSPVFSQTQLYDVKKGSVQSELDEDVTLKSGTDTDLSFENGGKIKDIFVSVGDQVKKGQVLAEVENSDYTVALHGASASRDAATAQLKQAKEDVNVQKNKLHSLKNGKANEYDVKAQKATEDKSLAGVEVQQALLSAAQSAVEGANSQLAKTRLIAPSDGVIADKMIETGEVVAPAGPVMKLASGDNLEADAYVSELDVKKIAVGENAQISLSSTAENSITVAVKVKNIYPAETIQNGVPSYRIIFDLAGQNSDLKSGMTGTAKISLSDADDAILIPQSSLFSDGGKKYVMIMSGGFPERKEVQVGASGADGTVEIMAGLSVGDKIIKF